MTSGIRKKYLLFGPLPPPYHGQSVAFSVIVESFQPSEILLINTTKFKFSIINSTYAILCTLYYFTFFKFENIYFTSTRSILGFIKDCPLLLLGRWQKKRIVNHLHGANFKSFYQKSGLLKPLINYCYKKVAISIVLLDEMKNEYEDFPAMEVRVIGNCYSNEFDLQHETVFQKKSQVVFLSNLMRSKGILEFLDACEVVLQNNPLVHVSIAGMPYSDDFMSKNAISELFYRKYGILKEKYPGNIDYLGVVTGQRKIELLFESDIFVLPTWHPSEAYPISIIEAMRAGNAIITTFHNFLPTIIKPENGILITPQSSRKIAEAIETLLHDKVRLKKIQQYNSDFAKVAYNQEKYVDAVKSVVLSHKH